MRKSGVLWQQNIMNPSNFARVELERVHCRQSILTRAFSLVEMVGSHRGSPAGLIPLPGFLMSTPNGSELDSIRPQSDSIRRLQLDFHISPFLARATQRCVRDCLSRSRRAPFQSGGKE